MTLPHGDGIHKVYIGGPIGGRANRNRRAFNEAASYVQHHGFIPITPFDISLHSGIQTCYGGAPIGDDHNYACYLLACMEMIADPARVDFITFLPDWDQSPGARAERAFATACGIAAWRFPTLDLTHLALGRERLIQR